MNNGLKLLSEVVFLRTYAETLESGKKESWEQTVTRTKEMHLRKFPELTEEIEDAFKFVYAKRVLPSMRSLQFGGYSIERDNCRIFNCSYTPVESFRDIGEILYILCCGTGVGFSVQSQHIRKLPIIESNGPEMFHVGDSKESWADTVQALLNNPDTLFDFSAVRPKGSKLSTGGTASGPEPFAKALEKVRVLLKGAYGRQLRPIEVHDIICVLADCVIVGGVRRTSLISLFDWWDEELLASKQGAWWEQHPYRARANNSANILRDSPMAEHAFNRVMDACFHSNAGEPGINFTDNLDWGINPCAEIALRPRQFCNLTTINAAVIESNQDFFEAVKAATVIGTLQATYSDFNYLSKEWKDSCEEERLLGVSMTGIAEKWDFLSNSLVLADGARLAVDVNASLSRKLGTRPAHRITCVKPEGTASAFLGTTSGVHSAHSPHYLRRVRINSGNPLISFLTHELAGTPAIEQDRFVSDNMILTVPVEKKGAIQRIDETALQLLERAKHLHQYWIKPGHRLGYNTHNVSLTVSYKPHEMEEIRKWMWVNRFEYNGISLLPFNDSTYIQTPFETCSEEDYCKWVKFFPESLDLSQVDWSETEDERKAELACSGVNGCEII